jgi:3-hydroxyacyl-[acyl-carrier-protein] dehydratase
MLIKNYYTVTGRHTEGDTSVFEISLNADCEVYRGHFPNEPISPGVCNIQMIKECAELVVCKPLIMNNLQQCRLTTLVTPLEHPNVEVRLQLTETENETFKLHATLGKGEDIYLEMIAELSVETNS